MRHDKYWNVWCIGCDFILAASFSEVREFSSVYKAATKHWVERRVFVLGRQIVKESCSHLCDCHPTNILLCCIKGRTLAILNLLIVSPAWQTGTIRSSAFLQWRKIRIHIFLKTLVLALLSILIILGYLLFQKQRMSKKNLASGLGTGRREGWGSRRPGVTGGKRC